MLLLDLIGSVTLLSHKITTDAVLTRVCPLGKKEADCVLEVVA